MIYDLPIHKEQRPTPSGGVPPTTRQRALWIAISLALKTIAGGIIALAKAIDTYVG